MFSRFRNQLTGRVRAMLFPESKVLEKNFPIFVPASWNASESESLTIILSGASFLRERGKNCFEREEIQRWWISKQFSKDLLIKTIRLFPSISYPEITRVKFTSNNGYTVGFEGKDLADRNSCYRKSPETNALNLYRYSFRGALPISVIKSGLICAPSIRGLLFVCFTRHWQMFGKSDTENSYIDQESDFESTCREYIFPRAFSYFFFFFIHSDFHAGKINKWMEKKKGKTHQAWWSFMSCSQNFRLSAPTIARYPYYQYR